MIDLINTFVSGVFFLLAGIFGLVRHFLLEPRIPVEPKTPTWLLRVFFGFSTVMLYVGMRYLVAWYTGAALYVPPAATGLGVLIALAVFTYKGSLLYDTVTRKAHFSLDELIQRFKDM
jgi:uncharacterized membrane protein